MKDDINRRRVEDAIENLGQYARSRGFDSHTSDEVDRRSGLLKIAIEMIRDTAHALAALGIDPTDALVTAYEAYTQDETVQLERHLRNHQGGDSTTTRVMLTFLADDLEIWAEAAEAANRLSDPVLKERANRAARSVVKSSSRLADHLATR
ncbi:hypothetical protein ACIBHX_47065 [Nonomuraea sp. NPDC050536]|uniref:hypothetical protein n=1 Tax=Nonomuraea sp. NPDC050536 TaxID=3364366 RepID=UPI0037CB8EBD